MAAARLPGVASASSRSSIGTLTRIVPASSVARPSLRAAGPLERVGRLALGLADRGEGRLERELRFAQARAGIGYQLLGQAKPLRDREGLGSPGEPDRQSVRRAERVEVELD